MNSVIASEAKQSRAVTAYSGLPRPPEQIRGLRHDGAGLPPDANAFFGRQVERIAFLDVERLVPGVEIAHRQRPVHARRVAVGRELLAQRRVARLGRPGLGIGDEEALVAGYRKSTRLNSSHYCELRMQS